MTTRRSPNATQWQESEARLREARAQLLRTAATTADELVTLPGPEPGAPIEDAARQEVIDILARLGDRERYEIEEIDAALERLRVATYGVCERCGASIPLPRLRALPATRHCLACQDTRG